MNEWVFCRLNLFFTKWKISSFDIRRLLKRQPTPTKMWGPQRTAVSKLPQPKVFLLNENYSSRKTLASSKGCAGTKTHSEMRFAGLPSCVNVFFKCIVQNCLSGVSAGSGFLLFLLDIGLWNVFGQSCFFESVIRKLFWACFARRIRTWFLKCLSEVCFRDCFSKAAFGRVVAKCFSSLFVRFANVFRETASRLLTVPFRMFFGNGFHTCHCL